MSIVSDFGSFFNNTSLTTYDIYIYDETKSLTTTQQLAFSIYTVLEESIEKNNVITERPLEESLFTVDAQQIKPFTFTVRGYLYPPENVPLNNYNDILNNITDQVDQLLKYIDSTTLFYINNQFTFASDGYAPLKLITVRQFKSTDITIPEITLTFKQVQIGFTQLVNTQQEPSNQ